MLHMTQKAPTRAQKANELRVCAGTRGSAQSCIWKIWTRGNDTYISCSTYGGDVKVSLHESGQSQWSKTDEWVKRQTEPSITNRQRHITKWNTPRPQPGKPISAFRIMIPGTELREPPTSARQPKTTLWLSGFPTDHTLCIQLFVVACPDEAQHLPDEFRLLKCLPLKDGRTVIVVAELAIWTEFELSRLRAVLLKEAREHAAEIDSSARGHLFVEPGETVGPGFFEFAVGLPEGAMESSA